MPASLQRIVLVFILITGSLNQVHSQSLDYPRIFGPDWNKASAYERENRKWMEPLLKKNNIPYPVAIAIIFPELIRYSALRDKMEVTLLKALYINLGDDYADFSIGVFQMKPSFAMMVREEAKTIPRHRLPGIFRKPTGTDIRNFRKQIITELEDPHTQLDYLIAFIKICEKKYRSSLNNEVQEIEFLSTAYNFGIDKSADQIKSMTGRKFFNSSLFSTKNYSYADVSLFWYNEYKSGNE